MSKRFYVTKKQVDSFIERHKEHYNSLEEFIIDLQSNIANLEDFDNEKYPDANKCQIKFYQRVLVQVKIIQTYYL